MKATLAGLLPRSPTTLYPSTLPRSAPFQAQTAAGWPLGCPHGRGTACRKRWLTPLPHPTPHLGTSGTRLPHRVGKPSLPYRRMPALSTPMRLLARAASASPPWPLLQCLLSTTSARWPFQGAHLDTRGSGAPPQPDTLIQLQPHATLIHLQTRHYVPCTTTSYHLLPTKCMLTCWYAGEYQALPPGTRPGAPAPTKS